MRSLVGVIVIEHLDVPEQTCVLAIMIDKHGAENTQARSQCQQRRQ